MSCVGLVGGASVSAVSADSISHTGPKSYNKIMSYFSSSYYQKNDTDIHVTNSNHQTATTGDAKVSHNTNGGNSYWGDAGGYGQLANYTQHNPKDGCDHGSNGSNGSSGGSAVTGDASNYNSTHISAAVNNSAPATGSGSSTYGSSMGMSGGSGGGTSSNNTISNTGPKSYNAIYATWKSSYKVVNDTDVSVNNSNYQTAKSGDATVSGNTSGGSAETGDATNYNATSISVVVKN